GLPLRSRTMTAETRQLIPRLTAVSRAKQSGVFNARENRVWIVKRRLEMPNSFELPRLQSAVIKLVRGERLTGFLRRVVNKLVALTHRHTFGRGGRRAGGRSRLKPRLAAIVGALNDLTKPAAGLRRVNAVRIHSRTLHVVNLPAGEMRATDVPFLTFSI